jgi:hypothetical protein
MVNWSARTDGEPICGFVSGVIPLARYRAWIIDQSGRMGAHLPP